MFAGTGREVTLFADAGAACAGLNVNVALILTCNLRSVAAKLAVAIWTERGPRGRKSAGAPSRGDFGQLPHQTAGPVSQLQYREAAIGCGGKFLTVPLPPPSRFIVYVARSCEMASADVDRAQFASRSSRASSCEDSGGFGGGATAVTTASRTSLWRRKLRAQCRADEWIARELPLIGYRSRDGSDS